MRAILVRAVVFSIGVFAFWLAYLLEEVSRMVADGDKLYGTPVLDAFQHAGDLALSSGIGVFLGLAAARRATPLLRVWLTGPAGVLFGFLIEPVVNTFRTGGLPVFRTLFGFLLTVAIAAAIFAWLCAQSVQLLRHYSPAIRNEYHRIKSNRLEMTSFVLALSPWLLAPLQVLGVPGFG
jgi:hypothetical protein